MAMQKTLNSEKCIVEMDGPKRSYFEITDGENLVRLVYQSYGFQGTEEWCKAQIDKVLEKAKEALPVDGIIVWRERPLFGEIKGDERGRGTHYSYCRFVTSPPLPKEFFETYGKREDASLRVE